MKRGSSFPFISLLVVLAVSACGAKPDVPIAASPTFEASGSGTQAAGPGDSSLPEGLRGEWPAGIPAEIPILEGTIDMVMEAPGSHIRIFYSELSDQQVSEYLARLQAQGFRLEYIAYVQEGFPDTSEEKLARGEFDAVDITRGDYHMRLEVGGGSGTYDIDTAAFATAPPAPMPTTPTWPVDLPPDLPQPATCSMHDVIKLALGGYRIDYRCAGDRVQDEYITALRAAGFVEVDRLENEYGEIVEITLQGDSVAVKAMGYSNPPYFFVNVEPLQR
jgi:hypothetical protein